MLISHDSAEASLACHTARVVLQQMLHLALPQSWNHSIRGFPPHSSGEDVIIIAFSNWNVCQKVNFFCSESAIYVLNWVLIYIIHVLCLLCHFEI